MNTGYTNIARGGRGRDRMVVEFVQLTVQPVPITTNVVSSNPAQAWCTPVSSTIKHDRHDITEILLKVTLSTIKQTKYGENN